MLNKNLKFVEAIYTYQGDIYCLNMGEDFPFDDLSEKEKSTIHQEIMNNRYVLNKSFQ